MRKTNLLLLLALTLTACGDRNDTAPALTNDDPQNPSYAYLAYVQKMIGTASDDNEPWDIDTVQVEQFDDSEAIDVM